MNCKQGDLAIIVKSAAGNEGKIVRCVRFIGHLHGWFGTNRWEVDIDLMDTNGDLCRHIRDDFLIPIRDSDKED